jgi:hypothetical protein
VQELVFPSRGEACDALAVVRRYINRSPVVRHLSPPAFRNRLARERVFFLGKDVPQPVNGGRLLYIEDALYV